MLGEATRFVGGHLVKCLDILLSISTRRADHRVFNRTPLRDLSLTSFPLSLLLLKFRYPTQLLKLINLQRQHLNLFVQLRVHPLRKRGL
jgi:hypothetical protein